MNLSKNNIFAIYYRWIYGNLPNDICSFFWGSVFGVLFFFLFVPGRLISYKLDPTISKLGRGSLCWLVYCASLAVGGSLVGDFGYEFTNLWGVLLLGPLLGAGVLIVAGVVLFGGTVLLIYTLNEKLPETTVIQNTKDWIGAIKKSHCTKINWK